MQPLLPGLLPYTYYVSHITNGLDKAAIGRLIFYLFMGWECLSSHPHS